MLNSWVLRWTDASCLLVLCRMHTSSAAGTLHLTAANAYICSSLEQRQAGGAALAWMPRAPSTIGQAGSAKVGISGFAFQGTNGHVILGLMPQDTNHSHIQEQLSAGALASGSSHSHSSARWGRTRHWYASRPHRLLVMHVTCRKTGAGRFECGLAANPGMAFLWQHQVSGRAILPGAAMFEAAFAAAAVLLPEGSAVGLVAASISAPVLLKSPSAEAPDTRQRGSLPGQMLIVAVQRDTGAGELSSRDGSGGSRRHSRPTLHLTARAAQLGPPAKSGLTATGRARPCHALPIRQSAPTAGVAAWSSEAVGSLDAVALPAGSDGYHCHPALVDASTHFGAVFDLAALNGGAARVPVALGCYTASASMPPCTAASGPSALFAGAGQGLVAQDGSRTSSFYVAQGTSPAGLPTLRLQHLQSQPLASRAAPAAEKASAELVLAATCHTYSTAWQVAVPVASTGGGTSSLAASHGPQLLAESASVCIPPLTAASAAAAATAPLHQWALVAYAPALRLLQSIAHGRQQRLTAVGCTSMACLPALGSQAQPAVGAQAAAIGGLLRVAALEQPAWQLVQLHADSNAPRLTQMPVLHQADAHGAAVSSATALLPQLLLRDPEPQEPALSHSCTAHPSCHVISGGMGGLGQLTARWFADSVTAPLSLVLLGRSGLLPTADQSQENGIARLAATSTVSVTLTQCDLATAGDAAAPLGQSQRRPAIATFTHTAGVLSDRLIPNQLLSDARRVFAPKLAGLAAAAPRLVNEPLQLLLLFSSVSAALGNRGQSPYAAANAVLDASARAMSQQGAIGCSIQWGAWAGAGMAAATHQLLQRLSKQGGQNWAGQGCWQAGKSTAS